MCGIAGAIGKFSERQANDIARSMTAALIHRGPDDSGVRSWAAGSQSIALGSTRLSILDLSAAGHQPMTDPSGRYWVVFNGEIYNFLELRKILDPEKTLFRTGTDTEVILHTYRRWSEAGFQRFRGMFAFALFDMVERKLQLVRDPLGIKPVYFHISDQRFLFASELQALLASGQFERRLDPGAVSHFLSSGWVGASKTAVSGIKLLEPGEILSVDLTGERLAWRISRYVSEPDLPEQASRFDRNESIGHMRHLLEQSMKCHLVSDVPVGLFLSGGIDSTALLHLMRDVGRKTPKTFTVVFPDKRFNENQIAKRIAQRYGAEHHEIHLGEQELLAQLPSALSAMDQPTMDGVNTFVVAKAVRSAGIKAALSGLGGDEVFAGYPSFRRAKHARRLSKVPLQVRRAFATSCRRARQHKLWDFIESDCTPQSVYSTSRRLFGSTEIRNLIPETPGSEDAQPFAASDDGINDISRLELQGYMTGQLLRDTDVMSMANSLEVRVPFVDRVVIEHALRLPGEWKVARSISKPLLLEAMRGAVPRYVWNRRKMGFVIPFETWMRKALRGHIEEAFTNRQLAERVGLSSDGLAQVWNGFLQGSIRWSKPWSLFVLLRWCERQRVFL